MEKSTHTMKNVWVPISQTFSICWILLHFPMLCEIDEEANPFPSVGKYTIG